MSRKPWSVWIGFDPREAAAFAVARASIRRWHRHVPIHGVVLSELQAAGMYKRPTERRLGKLWDVISEAPMSTEFAITRFLVPEIVRRRYPMLSGWALFMDCDVLVRGSLNPLLALLDDEKALFCVKHNHEPTNALKMDGAAQVHYRRKNWSSVMAFNIDHVSNRALTVELVNTLPGRDLHRMCWLEDKDIGELPPIWNYLVGHTEGVDDPQVVHFTEGGPWFEAFRDVPYADEWRGMLEQWAA